MKRAGLALLLVACSKEPPKPTVEASAPIVATTCEQGPWEAAARAQHRATAAKLAGDTAPLILNVLVTKPAKAVTNEIHDRLMDKIVEKGTRALGKEERAVYFAQQLLGEVHHGGLHQFFTSAAGDCAMQTRTGLTELGHAALLNLYVRALDQFRSSGPVEDRQARWKQVDAISSSRNAWDETTQAMNRIDDIDEHIARYVKTHSALLDLPPRKY